MRQDSTLYELLQFFHQFGTAYVSLGEDDKGFWSMDPELLFKWNDCNFQNAGMLNEGAFNLNR